MLRQPPTRLIRRTYHLRRVAGALLCLLLVGMLLYDWQQSQPYNDGTWARVLATGVLTVGMDASYPPFADVRGTQPEGLDVDIANEIGRRLGVKVQIANMGFDGLYEALKDQQVDALISALPVDPTRVGTVLYSRSYVDAGQAIVSRDGRYPDMASLDGRTLAVEYGSEGDETARLWQRRLHVLKIVHFTTADDALNALQQGQADAALCDTITTRLYIAKHPGLVISPELVTHSPYAAATRTSSYDLAGAINDALDAMQKDGTLTVILDRWL
ncbi:MAG TPA: transporter substrate-binding domain-containing protein [Aggregatilineales bacterium]|nr:transporter substrate-binding domain-containing protein [Aggregatilineales bacterium]